MYFSAVPAPDVLVEQRECCLQQVSTCLPRSFFHNERPLRLLLATFVAFNRFGSHAPLPLAIHSSHLVTSYWYQAARILYDS